MVNEPRNNFLIFEKSTVLWEPIFFWKLTFEAEGLVGVAAPIVNKKLSDSQMQQSLQHII